MQIMAYKLALGMPGLTEWIIIGALGLLIFGKRLPEVGRSLGKGIIEFKKGLRGIEDEFDFSSTSSSKPSRRSEDWADTPSTRRDQPGAGADPPSTSPYPESSVPKSEPPTTAPVPRMKYEPQPTQD